MKTTVVYTISNELAEKLAFENETAVSRSQKFEFDAKGDKIKNLVLQAGGSIDANCGTLKVPFNRCEFIKGEWESVVWDEIINEENIEKNLLKMADIRKKSDAFERDIELFEKITKTDNSRFNRSAIAKGLITPEKLEELVSITQKICKLDPKYLKKVFDTLGYQDWKVIEIAEEKTINSLDIEKSKKILEGYTLWQKEVQEQKEKEKKEEEKKEEEQADWIEKYGSERLKKGISLGFGMEDLLEEEIVMFLLEGFNFYKIDEEDEEGEEDDNPSLEKMELYESVISSLDEQKKHINFYPNVTTDVSITEENVTVVINNEMYAITQKEVK